LRFRWPLTAWLALLLVLAGVLYFGARWILSVAYPLPYRATLFARAQEYGLDPYLVAAVVRAESGFRPAVRSSQGARGLMQIMPETGEWIAGQLNLPYADELLDDPDYNMRLGCWYLDHLQDEFGADTVLVLAAYNAGRTNVQQWLRENQWTGEHRTLDQIPFTETRLYVARVTRNYAIYRRLYAP
jgi:soluble lytic murein transglycosylase